MTAADHRADRDELSELTPPQAEGEEGQPPHTGPVAEEKEASGDGTAYADFTPAEESA